ncbi:MAG TPA: isoprenyl transferase [Syntrophales bacterium]|nr:isoprenyl transferase [Syntrophales bacterium]HOL59092.1 isoprenyl transferase [Syntrophales bacterium]HPO35399.1 isoprenyl transferase [Syntrophales bacterium]
MIMEDFEDKNLPRHIAIIMDGNGRWAKKHALGRVAGHRKGAEAVRRTVRACRNWGIKYLTLFAFSSENWSRPAKEVNALMRLLKEYIASEVEEIRAHGIRLNVIGEWQALRGDIRLLVEDAMKKTAQNDAMIWTIALSYGGRGEIVEAARRIGEDVAQGRILPKDIDQQLFTRYLYTYNLPDPDLLIRTSGEYRISNFLLWQSAYTEFYFTDVLWPDFSEEDLMAAIREYQRRERRFGQTTEQLKRRGEL